MTPPRFPSEEADLDAWAVYSDELQMQGDPRGALIAADLALTGDEAQLREFRRLSGQLCRLPGQRFSWLGPLAVEWNLAHARTLVHTQVQRPHPSPVDGLLRAERFLRSEWGRTVKALRVEWLELAQLHSTQWRALVGSLPPGCRRLELAVRDLTPGAFSPSMLTQLGPVRELSLLFLGMHPELFVSDALDELDLRFLRLNEAALDRVFKALAQTTRVVVRLGNLEVPRTSLPTERVLFGHPDDAVLHGLNHPGCLLLQRTPVQELQRRRGYLGARAQLNRWPRERWGLLAGRNSVTATAYRGSHFSRHGGARWTLRAEEARNAGASVVALALNGRPLAAGEPVPLQMGDVVSMLSEGVERSWRFDAPASDRHH